MTSDTDIRQKSSNSSHNINIKIPTPARDDTPASFVTLKNPQDNPAIHQKSTYIQLGRFSQDNILKDLPILIGRAPRTYGLKTSFSKKIKSKSIKSPLADKVRIIENVWLAYRNRQLFKLLKHSVCAAENNLSYELLKKISPKEASFFKDKSFSLKIRLRFGGNEFPPKIYFKVFFDRKISNIKYISGKHCIKAGSDAARDACSIMGRRNFYNLMIKDILHEKNHPISQEYDVTTLKDYMQYRSLLDELPANMGGKENCWRQLTLEDLSRQNLFYDVVDFLYNNKLTNKLIDNLPILMTLPTNEDIQKMHIDVLSQSRPTIVHKPVMIERLTGRQTKQALSRVEKMRQVYSRDRIEDRDEEWEKEADELYKWTKELTFNEDIL